MKKILKWSGIIAGVLVGLLIIGAVALPLLLPLEKIKNIATEQISKAISREVKIEKVSFNLFEGIKLNKLTVSNRPGYAKDDFISADSIVLRYAFWPIFKRQIIVKEISLVKPEILIEKAGSGKFNFSDMGQGSKQKSGKAEQQKTEKKQDFSLIVDSFSIKDARITYIDHSAGTKSEIKNANLKIAGITLSMLRPIDFSFSATANYQGKDIPISLAGKADVNLLKEEVKLSAISLNLAGESAALSAFVSNWQSGPNINFSISSNKLTIDPLLAIFAAGAPKEKKKAVRGELTRSINKSMANLPYNLRVQGDIKINNLSFLNFGVDKVDAIISLSKKNLNAEIKEIKLYEGSLSGLATVNLAASGLSYNVKNLKLENFNAAPFSNDIVDGFLTKLEDSQDLKNKISGRLNATVSLAGSGVEAPDIMANLNASGSLTLKEGQLKRIKTLDAIADQIKAPALKRDINISLLTSNFKFSGQVLTLSELDLRSSRLGIKFNGGLDIGNLKYVVGNRLSLRADPSLIKDLPKEYELLKDKDGWLELTVELVGDLKKPFPRPILDKPIEAVVGKLKVKIDAKKVEIEQQVSKEVEAKKEEVKQQVKDEAKKQLQNLIKL